jgi:DNA-binding SARP family transcriptional activator/Flp pilus assembly protein TadD
MNGTNITYRQQKSLCNKPGCRKCREGIGHGPYWYAYQVMNGRTVRTYIGKTLPAGVQQGQVIAASPVLAPSLKTSSIGPAKPLFRLTTLGQLRLEFHGENDNWQAVTEAGWRLPQARALLTWLICAPNRQATQQEILTRLWPDLDEKSAALNLKRASAALKQLLGAAYSKRPDSRLSLVGQAQFWLDCQAFEDILAQARVLPSAHKAARISLLEHALKLYNGDFLPEERTTNWVQERRKALRRQWVTGTLELVDLSLDEQRPAGAIDRLNQLVAADPTNEAAVQRLMFILARQQRRVEAVQAYQRLTSILHHATGKTPLPETQSLFQDIQQGHDTLFRPITMETSYPIEGNGTNKEAGLNAQQDNENWTRTAQGDLLGRNKRENAQGLEREPASTEISIGRNNQSPLVGRDLEITTLQQMLAQVESMQSQAPENALFQDTRQTPHAHCIVLMGEAGIGKTRLAEESAREAQRRGWTVIWSHAYPQEQGIPYRLWTAALRNVLTYTPKLARQAAELASVATYQPLRALVPEVQETLVGVGMKSGGETAIYEALPPEQEELRLRDAVYTFLTRLSVTSPLLIVLDDIQWSDESSAQMLGYFTRRMTEHPIALLATCRENELADNRVLNNLLAHMQREQVVEIIHVQRLSDEHIGALVADLPAPAITNIQNQAEGNPFFAEELAYSLRSSGEPGAQLPVGAQEKTQALPGPIAAALNQRLNRLSTDCQKLLGKAAVLGGSFDLSLISAMETGHVDSEDETVLDLLDEARTSGVLAEEGSGNHITYHFWHPLLANHLYHGLSATRRALLHLRIADVLHQIHQAHETEEAATITQHLIKGGAEPTRIAQEAELAGHHAYNLLAYPDAERYYRVALSHFSPTLLDRQASLPPDLALRPETTLERRLHLAFLVERLADCTRIQGNFRETREFYTRALQLRTLTPRTFASPEEERQETEIQAMHWNEIAWLWRYTGDVVAARNSNALGEEVLRKAGITDGPAWGSLRYQQASRFWQEGYHEQALQAGQQSLALFTDCLVRAVSNSTSQATIPANRQTRITRTVQGDPADLGRVENFLGIIYMVLGQLSEALKHLHQALAIHDRYDRRHEGANVSVNIGHTYLLKGDYELARPFFERSLRYVERSGDILVKSVTICNLAQLAAATGQFEQAEKFYHEALTLVTQMNDREYLSSWNIVLGELLQEQGRFKEAASAIRYALAIGRAMSNQPCIGVALVALANLRLALVEDAHANKTPDGLRALRHANIDLQRALNMRGLDAEQRTRAHLAQARASSLLGDLPLALQQAQEACSDAKKYEFKEIETRCQQLLNKLSQA